MLRCVGYCSFADANSWKFQIASHTFWSMNLPTLTNNILYITRRKFRTTSIDLLPYPYMESSFIGSSGALSMWLEILLIDNRMTIRFYMRVGKKFTSCRLWKLMHEIELWWIVACKLAIWGSLMTCRLFVFCCVFSQWPYRQGIFRLTWGFPSWVGQRNRGNRCLWKSGRWIWANELVTLRHP